MIPDETLAEIEAAAKAATDGPWIDWECGVRTANSSRDPADDGDPLPVANCDLIAQPFRYTVAAANARFITLACNNAAAMVEEIRALREFVAACQPIARAYMSSGVAEGAEATVSNDEGERFLRLYRAAKQKGALNV